MRGPQRLVKAKYRVGKPQLVKRQITKCSIDPTTKSLQQDKTIVEEEMYMVYFPRGHSVRMTKQELIFHKYHLRPQLVDMATGETIDFGGDPYEFMGMDDEGREPGQEDMEFTLEDEFAAAETEAKGRKKAEVNA